MKNDLHDLLFTVSAITKLTGDEVTTCAEGSAVWVSATPNEASTGENDYWLYLEYDKNLKLTAKIYEHGHPSTGLQGFYAVIGYCKYHGITVQINEGAL